KALEQIRHRLGVTAAVFLGDDITDEDAFRTLFGPDLGVKVGPGDSLARHRVAEPIDVGRVLARLAEERTKWLTGSQATPIERLSMLTDQRTVVLIDDHAKLVWGCMPRIDSSALFADLLGGPGAGAFEITPIHGEPPVLQDYRGDTFVLRTRWRDVTLTDYLDCSEGRTLQRAGRTDLVRVLEGTGRVRIEFAPRLDFGRTPTHLVVRDNGLAIDDTLDPVVLVSPGVQWHIDEDGKHQRAWADVELRGKPVVLELRYGTGSLNASVLPEAERRRQTEVHWSDWASKLTLPEMWPNLVKRGALALRGLVHGPTGAIAAAGTTSLPEHMGGVRNWDYRYCWPRDAAMAARTLTRLGSTGEALRFLDWLLGIVDEAGSAERLAPVYGVTGLDCSVEAEIAELAGYGGSRPVRIGNAAARQVQLDVFGPIVDLVATLMHRGAALSGEHWRVVEAMADAVAARWAEPDHGIWEIRGPRRHHVHSKVMCWVTLDRAAEISRSFLGRPREDFEALADTIKAEVIDRGWNEMLGGFGAAYDVEEWDAATLFIGLTGLIDPSDDRFKRTVEGTEQALRDGPTVYRYRGEDGLPGVEGGFHICAAWLAMSHAAIGQPQRAREIIDEIAALSGHTGLLSEQFDPAAKRALGNHPQAYSHLGLIDAILDVEALDK
ncbi:MAG: trehalase-like domain-containing protein, partial [Planctomycetota bacterium]